MARLLAALALLLALVGVGVPASAHTRSETHSSWSVVGTSVRVSLTVPEPEAVRLKQGNEAVVPNDRIAAYLAKHVGVTEAGKACAVTEPMRTAGSTIGYRRFETAFQCPTKTEMALHFGAFFDLVPTHTNFAQVQTDDGKFVEQLFDKDRQALELSGEGSGNALENASFFEYIRMGVMHILTGVDHMSFLVGLVLISRRLKDLLFVVTGFTLGHSLTLALAVTGILRPHAEYIDALVALTIALIGAENIAVQTQKPALVALGMGGLLIAMALGKVFGLGGLPVLLTLGAGLFSANYLMVSGHLKDAARIRLVVTLVFGLIHGFGFAADLLEQQIPPAKLAQLLVGFNLGVEIGQISLVLTVIAIAAALVKLKIALPRPIVTDLASAFLVGLGFYWFISRSYA
jgi:hypothetical protein